MDMDNGEREGTGTEVLTELGGQSPTDAAGTAV